MQSGQPKARSVDAARIGLTQHIRFKFDHVEGVRLRKGNTEHSRK
jgi:hypothetical protein